MLAVMKGFYKWAHYLCKRKQRDNGGVGIIERGTTQESNRVCTEW
jgi:hypothetical protein